LTRAGGGRYIFSDIAEQIFNAGRSYAVIAAQRRVAQLYSRFTVRCRRNRLAIRDLLLISHATWQDRSNLDETGRCCLSRWKLEHKVHSGKITLTGRLLYSRKDRWRNQNKLIYLITLFHFSKQYMLMCMCVYVRARIYILISKFNIYFNLLYFF